MQVRTLIWDGYNFSLSEEQSSNYLIGRQRNRKVSQADIEGGFRWMCYVS